MVGLILRYRLVRPVIPKLLALGGARLLALVGTQLGRPLMYDDANFALAAKAVADTGLAFGNQGCTLFSEGLLARGGGWTPPVLRLLAVFGGLASAGLTYLSR